MHDIAACHAGTDWTDYRVVGETAVVRVDGSVILLATDTTEEDVRPIAEAISALERPDSQASASKLVRSCPRFFVRPHRRLPLFPWTRIGRWLPSRKDAGGQTLQLMQPRVHLRTISKCLGQALRATSVQPKLLLKSMDYSLSWPRRLRPVCH